MKKILFILALLILFTSCQKTKKEDMHHNPGISESSTTGKAYVSFRIGVPQWFSEKPVQ
ncbi:MAG: hypothetical protein IPN67_11230 [Bacteroidales bacterium]|nr:hypothetical protein [Bacteroidales bacterium]